MQLESQREASSMPVWTVIRKRMCFKGGLTISGLDPPATQHSLIRIHILVAASGKKTQLAWQGQV